MDKVARRLELLKLEGMGVTIDTLTEQQVKYLNQWEEGT